MTKFAKQAALLMLGASLISLPTLAQENAATRDDPAQSQPADAVVVGQGVVCDTAQQVERFTSLITDSSNVENAIEVVNTEVSNPRACGMVLAAFLRGGEVGEVRNGGRSLKVVEITILAVPVGNQWHYVSPLKQYTAFPIKGVEI